MNINRIIHTKVEVGEPFMPFPINTYLHTRPKDKVNPWKNEVWDMVNHEKKKFYHKDKTVENCLLKYGMAKWNRGAWNSKNKIDVGFVYPNAEAHVAGKVMPEDIVDLYQLAKEGKLSLGNTSHHWQVVNKNEIPQHFIDTFKRVIEENRGSWAVYNNILSGNQWTDQHWALHWSNTRMSFGDITVHAGRPRSNQANSLFSGAYFTKFKMVFTELEGGNVDLWAMPWAWSKVDKWEIAYLGSDGSIIDLDNMDRYGIRGDIPGISSQYFGFVPKYLNKTFYKYEGELPWFINWDQLKSCDWAFVHARINDGHLQGYNKKDFAEIPANTWRINAGNYYSESSEEEKLNRKWGEGVSDGAFWQSAFLKSSNISKVGVILDFGLINADRFTDNFFGDNLTEIRLKNLNGIDYDFTNYGKWGNLTKLSKESVVYLFNNLKDIRGSYIQGMEWSTKTLRPNQTLTCPTQWSDKITYTMIKEANRRGWGVIVDGILYKDTHLTGVYYMGENDTPPVTLDRNYKVDDNTTLAQNRHKVIYVDYIDESVTSEEKVLGSRILLAPISRTAVYADELFSGTQYELGTNQGGKVIGSTLYSNERGVWVTIPNKTHVSLRVWVKNRVELMTLKIFVYGDNKGSVTVTAE